MQFPQSLLPLLAQGGQLVTANARAARDFRECYGEHHIGKGGATAWESPHILDWHAFLAEQWQQLLRGGAEDRLLLSPLQEESLWLAIVQPVVEARSLISAREIARLAQNAYGRLAAYGGTGKLRQGPWDAGISSQDRNSSETREPELFRKWALEFERMCGGRWLSAAQLPWVLADAYRTKQLQVPVAIAWAGFDRTSPAENALREALRSAGCPQTGAGWEMQAVQHKVVASNPHQELEACAHWVGERLAEDPTSQIGILLQDASGMRAQIDRVFRRVLMPASEGLQSTTAPPRYEFTLGLPLHDVPMVRAALLFLRWLTAPIDRVQISWLLTTGFLGRLEDASLLGMADAYLLQEELLPPEERFDQFARRMDQLAQHTKKSNVPATLNQAVAHWIVRMRRAESQLASRPGNRGERPAHQWVAAISSALETAGWPGSRAEDSVAFQVRERWVAALDELVLLDFSSKWLSFSDFLDQLTAHAATTLFSAESQGAPVTISGIFESAGRAFDAVWVLQMTDEAWPAHSTGQAMLPGWLQAELQMPRGDAGEDAALAATIVKRLTESASAIVFSYACEGDRGAQRPAAILAHLAEERASTPTANRSVCLTEEFEDDAAVPWLAGHEAGGQDVLRMQAACPFQAFAAKRLGARELRVSAHGFDAAQRGTVLHTVMHTLWDDPRMKNSAGLHALIAGNTLQGVIEQHVDKALGRYAANAGEWEKAYLQLERQRLCALVNEWLAVERDRPAFEVEAMEDKKEIEIAGLRLNVRLDRVDLIRGGQVSGETELPARVLMDYKTGKMQRAKWDGPRIDEPQLPLYAVASGLEGLEDVRFAQVRPGEVCFIGAAAAKPSPDSGAEFASRLDAWKGWLEDTSRAFQAGIATVDPKYDLETCKYCAFSGLCRVAELKASFSESAEGDEA